MKRLRRVRFVSAHAFMRAVSVGVRRTVLAAAPAAAKADFDLRTYRRGLSRALIRSSTEFRSMS